MCVLFYKAKIHRITSLKVQGKKKSQNQLPFIAIENSNANRFSASIAVIPGNILLSETNRWYNIDSYDW